MRISSNPTFTPAAVSPREALDLLERITALPGHRQITDAYLVGLARQHGEVLATLDRGVQAIGGPEGGLVDLIQG